MKKSLIGGKEELCLPFSWSFARVESCKPGFGLELKNSDLNA
jgi:hypothetical protein